MLRSAAKKSKREEMSVSVYNALARSKLMREVDRSFREATGFSLKLLRSDDSRVPTPPRRHENPFCKIMSTEASTCAACLRVQRELQRRLSRKLTPQQICCYAGMTDLAVPVVVGGEHIATLLAGQVFERRPKRQQFERVRRQLQKWGMRNHARQLERTYFKTPVASPKKIKASMRLLSILAAQLADFTNRCILISRTSEPPAVSQAKAFIHSHAAEQLSSRRVAEHVHVSEHYFCKLFKRNTGITVTEFVARVRVANAKKLLCDHRLRITDVAEKAGFNSISQFNRVFRRHARKSPTAYRADCC